MKTLMNIFWVIVAIICFETAKADYWYGHAGQRTLTVSDSIVTIKFNIGVPSDHYNTFAQDIESLDETFPPVEYSNKFYVYHIIDGYNYDSVYNETSEDPSVMFVFPSFNSQHGSVFKLNDYFIISFHDTVTQPAIDSLYQYYNVEQTDGPYEYTGTRVIRLTGDATMNTLEIANSIFESGLVNYSFPNMASPEKHDYMPDDSLFYYQYNLYNYGQTGGLPGIDIEVRKAWEYPILDSELVIAILDDGLVHYHEDYADSNILWSHGYDYVGPSAKVIGDDDDDPSPGEDEAHGTACQGIILAEKNNNLGVAGIAPHCKLLPVKVVDDEGYYSAHPEEYENAIRHALNYHRTYGDRLIISCSWGWFPDYGPPNLAAILDTAYIYGIPAVFSAGNIGEYTSRYPIGQQIGYPASLPTTIAVGAIRKTGERWNYSSTGPELEVVAP